MGHSSIWGFFRLPSLPDSWNFATRGEAMNARVRVGIIGTGRAATRRAEALYRSRRADVVAVASRRDATAQAFGPRGDAPLFCYRGGPTGCGQRPSCLCGRVCLCFSSCRSIPGTLRESLCPEMTEDFFPQLFRIRLRKRRLRKRHEDHSFSSHCGIGDHRLQRA
ncbi:MAG: Gfo/Idh/MocA family oxidoreductase [Candidatus Methylomirabilales bacterium]